MAEERKAPVDMRESGDGAVAQLGEHRLCKPRVAGSIPVRSTKVHRGYEHRIDGVFNRDCALQSTDSNRSVF